MLLADFGAPEGFNDEADAAADKAMPFTQEQGYEEGSMQAGTCPRTYCHIPAHSARGVSHR